ncbi:MAG: type II toxin-antitoxin system RelE/ParE family toxin, partial [Verrucomicrobiota bacterium]|nr:type II toxin-antitoxin system RelE/ParE family toxin [Verrucomicrobiota bacterium]
MTVRKSADFISDVEQQFEWYVVNANWEVEERYLDAIEVTCQLLGQHPLLGPNTGLTHPRLCKWRFIVVFRPFQKHVLFYEVNNGAVALR